MKRGLGIALGIAAIVTGIGATLLSIKTLFIGAFVGVLGASPLLLAVLAAVLVLLLPGAFGIAAIVMSARRPAGSTGAVVLGGVGLVVALVAGPAFYAAGEKVAPDPVAAAKKNDDRPPPPGCKPKATNLGAINQACTPSGYAQSDCPEGYICNDTMAKLYGDKAKPQGACEIVCLHKCECPSGTSCRNTTCQRGNDLPP